MKRVPVVCRTIDRAALHQFSKNVLARSVFLPCQKPRDVFAGRTRLAISSRTVGLCAGRRLITSLQIAVGPCSVRRSPRLAQHLRPVSDAARHGGGGWWPLAAAAAEQAPQLGVRRQPGAFRTPRGCPPPTAPKATAVPGHLRSLLRMVGNPGSATKGTPKGCASIPCASSYILYPSVRNGLHTLVSWQCMRQKDTKWYTTTCITAKLAASWGLISVRI